MKFSHLIVLSVQNTVVNGGALSIKNCFPSFSSSSAINAQTLSGTGRGGRLLITIILIILLFFLSVCRAHVVRVATKTKRSEWRFYFFRFFSFSWPLTRRKRWKFGPRLACPLFSLKKKRETHHTTEVRRRTWIENEGTPRFFAIFFVLLARMRWKSTSRTGRYRRLERVRFASVDTNGRFSLFSRVIFFDPYTRRGWMCIGNVRVLGECENMRRGLER